MATKTEMAIQDLQKVVATLQERLDNLREELRREVERLDSLPAVITALHKSCARVDERIRAVSDRLERSDRYRWALLGLVGGAILTFLANLVLYWVER